MPKPVLDLSGQAAIVPGASSGIGAPPPGGRGLDLFQPRVPRPADVQETGGRRGETDADRGLTHHGKRAKGWTRT